MRTVTTTPGTRLDRPSLADCKLENQFVTPFMTRKYEGVTKLNTALRKLLNQLKKETPNYVGGKSNVGGFHTGTKLLHRQEEPIVVVRNMIAEAVREFINEYVKSNCLATPKQLQINVWGWAVIMRPGDINLVHVHPDAKVSGVYYVHVPTGAGQGSSKEEGAIVFTDPRPRAEMNPVTNQIGDIVISPEAGTMILFPSYHQHAVMPFRRPGDRICISFNALF